MDLILTELDCLSKEGIFSSDALRIENVDVRQLLLEEQNLPKKKVWEEELGESEEDEEEPDKPEPALDEEEEALLFGE